MLKNPENGGIPAMATAPIAIVSAVTGMCCRSPPIRRMSCSSFIPWMTEPLPRKRSALKKACVIRWNAAAANAPTPVARNM